MSTITPVPENETPDQRRARFEAEYDHNHTPYGHKIQRNFTVDAEAPIDEESGLHIHHGLMESWQYPIGHSKYQPHPSSIAAQKAARAAGATDEDTDWH